MRIIVISTQNSLLSGAIVKYLKERGEMIPTRVIDYKNADEPFATCLAMNANVLLMEVTRVIPFTLDDRTKTARQVREALPNCKVALLCDDNADPEIAERIKDMKKLSLIDSFFYSSVSGEYISAVLDTL